MTRTPTLHQVLTRSATVLAEHARELRKAHSYRGQWFGEYDYAKDSYDEMMTLAKALRGAAKGRA